MNIFQRLYQKFMGSRLFRTIIWGAGATDYSKWSKIDMVQQAYERNPAFAAIVDRVADLVSNLPVYVEYTGDNYREGPTQRHGILEAMERSNGGRKGLIELTAKFLMVTGEAYLQKMLFEKRDGRQDLTGFVVMPAQHTNPIQGTPAQPVMGFEYIEKGRETFQAHEVVYIRKPSLSEYFHGNSPVTALAETIDLQNSAITWNKNVAKRGGLPALVVKMPGITPEEARTWKTAWAQVNGGANNAGLPAVEGGRDTEYINLNFKPNEAEWAKAIEITNRIIAMRTGFPSELLNDPSGKTYANVQEATKTLYRDVILPMAELIYGEISRNCREYYADRPFIRIDIEKVQALVDDKTKLMDAVIRATGGPVLSVNEGREVLEYPASEKPEHNEIAAGKQPVQTANTEPLNANA